MSFCRLFATFHNSYTKDVLYDVASILTSRIVNVSHLACCLHHSIYRDEIILMETEQCFVGRYKDLSED